MNEEQHHRENRKILLLNKNYQFLNIIDIRIFLRLWFLEKIDIIKHTSENISIHPRIDIKYPSVVVMKYMVKAPYRDVKLSRESIIRRDKYICQYSGKKLKKNEIEIDHIIPRSRGGRNTWDNLVVASKQMNNKKGNRTPKEADMILIRQPQKPKIHEVFKDFEREDWEEFFNF